MPGSSRKTHRVKRSKSVPKLTCSGRPIAVPLISRGKVRGVMKVGTPGKQNYTPDELDFLQAVASQVATAIENAQLYQEAEQSVEELRALSARLTEVQEEERTRIVNYLHTNLAQTLATAKMNLDLLSQQPNKDPAQLRKSLSSVILTIDEAIKETRGLMFDIRTPMLDDLGLIPAVRSYAKALFERTGVKVKIEANHSLKDLSENRRIMYFRIIQELLTNVAKHAKVSRAKLTLERRKKMDVIVVRDSGVGFDPKSLRLSHSAVTGLGLVAIREMVSHNKGHLDIHSAPAKGTTVTVSIPTKEPASIG
jgi:signal transduction histidine kinase